MSTLSLTNGADSFNGTNYNGLNNNNINNTYSTKWGLFKNRYNIDTYQKVFTNIDTYMRGYNPNINNTVITDNIENAKLDREMQTNDTESHLINDTTSRLDKNKLTNKDYSKYNQYNVQKKEMQADKFNDKQNSTTIKEKISKTANATEINIDKLRDFLIGLYMKYTQKDNSIYDYDIENVVSKENIINKSANQEIQEVNISKEPSILVYNNENNTAFTQDEINYLKKLVKNKINRTPDVKNYLTSEEKLNLINKIINENIIEDINNEFIKSFNESLITENNMNILKQTDNDKNFNESLNIIESEDVSTNSVVMSNNELPLNDKTISNSPIPSPFDPVKMDEIKEIQELKNTNNTQNDDKTNLDNSQNLDNKNITITENFDKKEDNTANLKINEITASIQ